VPGLVVGGYGDCRGGGVGGVGLDVPGRFEPPPGGGVVGEGRAEVGGGQRGAEGGQEVHGVRSPSFSITSRLSAISLSKVAKVCAAFRLGVARRRCGGGGGFLAGGRARAAWPFAGGRLACCLPAGRRRSLLRVRLF